MAWPNDKWRMELWSSTGAPAYPAQVQQQTQRIKLGEDYGFRPANPYDIAFKHRESEIPSGIGSRFAGFKRQAATDVVMLGQVSGDDPHDLAQTLMSLNSLTSRVQGEEVAYLYMRLWDGGAWQYFRRYCIPTSVISPLQPKTDLMATQPNVQMNLRCLDPGIYSDAMVTKTINVVGGAGSTGVFPTDGNRETQRLVVKIIKDDAGFSPSNVTVSVLTSGQTFSMIGSLTTLNDYWTIDCVTGLVTKTSGALVSDAIDLFFNDYLSLDSLDNITVVEGSGSTFTVYVYYLPRWQ